MQNHARADAVFQALMNRSTVFLTFADGATHPNIVAEKPVRNYFANQARRPRGGLIGLIYYPSMTLLQVCRGMIELEISPGNRAI